MKFSFSGLLRLRPFTSDAKEEAAVNEVYARSWLIQVGIVCSAVLVFVALYDLVSHPDGDLRFFMAGIACSTVTAGLLWNAGLKARALNQLFPIILVVIGIVFLL